MNTELLITLIFKGAKEAITRSGYVHCTVYRGKTIGILEQNAQGFEIPALFYLRNMYEERVEISISSKNL